MHPIKDPTVRSRPDLGNLKGGVALPQAITDLTEVLKPDSKTAARMQAKQQKAIRLLNTGLKALNQHDFANAAAKIEEALKLDPENLLAWRMLVFASENQGDFPKAFSAYEAVARLAPDDITLLRDVGQLACKMGKSDLAIKLFNQFLDSDPDNEDVINSLAGVYREQARFGDAVELLRNHISRYPERPLLWNGLGAVLSESGDTAGAMVFFTEALRLNPDFHAARFNRAYYVHSIDDPRTAIEEMEIAAKGLGAPKEVAKIRLAQACLQLLMGDLKAGFDAYEARFEGSSDFTTRYIEFGKRWTVEDDLKGKTLLVYGEQGLGDEVLFANVLQDTIAAVGPEGCVYVAVEPRLVPLFARSYPAARVMAYEGWRDYDTLYRTVDLGEAKSEIDLWTPIASLFRRFRTRVDAFPATPSFLVPDPERVAYWRQQLEASGPGPYVGVLWKSINMSGPRQRHYSPFDTWAPVLGNTKARFVNLQYGDAIGDLAEAKACGFDIWSPPGIDLKQDIDDLAALCAAMDVVIGPSTATTNISAAVGTKVWISAGPGWWPCFGTDHAPCYPTLRLFRTNCYDQWGTLMEEIGAALDQEVAMHHGTLKAG